MNIVRQPFKHISIIALFYYAAPGHQRLNICIKHGESFTDNLQINWREWERRKTVINMTNLWTLLIKPGYGWLPREQWMAFMFMKKNRHRNKTCRSMHGKSWLNAFSIIHHQINKDHRHDTNIARRMILPGLLYKVEI